MLILRWYRGLRKVGQGYDNYEQKRSKNKEYDNMEEDFFIECISLCLQ